MIDLSAVKSILIEIESLVDELHGLQLTDADAVSSKDRPAIRAERAKRSQEIQLLATRFELAASLTRVEFWYAKGEIDPLRRRRSD